MILITTICSCLVALALVGLVRLLAPRSGLMDMPNSRSSHAVPIPRGGGIAIVTVTLFVTALGFAFTSKPTWVLTAWIVGGGLVATAGFLDDLRGLPVIARLGLHVIAAILLLIAAGGMPPLPTSGGSITLGPIGWVVGGIAIVWSINLFNFMDGIDGLAAAQCVFVAGTGVLLSGLDEGASTTQLSLLSLAGAAAGFLVWNFPPAKIFMGDVGSGFVGFALAAGAFLTTSTGRTVNLWTWVVLNGLFFADATATLVTRLLRGQRVYEAHRLHAYQRWARRWRSHRAVTLVYTAINICWCLPWAVATVRTPAFGPILTAAALAPLFLIAMAAGAGRQEV